MSTASLAAVRRNIVYHLHGIDRTHVPFLAAIAAATDDDLPRLVYADWLEERGQHDRAFLIRWQCRNPSAEYPKLTPPDEGGRFADPVEYLPAHDPRRIAAKIIATDSSANCPLRMRWYRGKLYQWSSARGGFETVSKRECKLHLYVRVQDELQKIWQSEMTAWDAAGRRRKQPQVRSITTLLGRVVDEVERHAYRTSHPDPASGSRATPTPDDWHFDLLGWDDALGKWGRPGTFVRLDRKSPFFFDRGFAVCGEVSWPAGWRLRQVAALFARQPVTRVRLRSPHWPDVSHGGLAVRQGSHWQIRRGTPLGARSLPSDLFDLLADQWDSVHVGSLTFRTEREVAAAVERLERTVNDTIRDVLTGVASPSRTGSATT